MTRTSRVRRLNVVEPSPAPHEPQKPPAADSEVPQSDSADAADLDAALVRNERAAARSPPPYEILRDRWPLAFRTAR
jgi:hypothetical protein